MTQQRATEIIATQSLWPFWGNFERFMTENERHVVNRLWESAPGNWSRASVIYAIARGEITA